MIEETAKADLLFWLGTILILALYGFMYGEILLL